MSLRTRVAFTIILLLVGGFFAAPYYRTTAGSVSPSSDAPTLQIQRTVVDNPTSDPPIGWSKTGQPPLPNSSGAQLPSTKQLPSFFRKDSTLFRPRATSTAVAVPQQPVNSPTEAAPPVSNSASIPPLSIPPASVTPASIPPLSIPPASVTPASIPPLSIPPASVTQTSATPASIPPTSSPAALSLRADAARIRPSLDSETPQASFNPPVAIASHVTTTPRFGNFRRDVAGESQATNRLPPSGVIAQRSDLNRNRFGAATARAASWTQEPVQRAQPIQPAVAGSQAGSIPDRFDSYFRQQPEQPSSQPSSTLPRYPQPRFEQRMTPPQNPARQNPAPQNPTPQNPAQQHPVQPFQAQQRQAQQRQAQQYQAQQYQAQQYQAQQFRTQQHQTQQNYPPQRPMRQRNSPTSSSINRERAYQTYATSGQASGQTNRGLPVRRSVQPIGVDPPSSRASPAKPRVTQWHRIVNGDSLESLAIDYFGDGNFALHIFNANRTKLVSPTILPIGLELKIPEKPSAPSNPWTPPPNTNRPTSTSSRLQSGWHPAQSSMDRANRERSNEDRLTGL